VKGIKLTLEVGLKGHSQPVRGDEHGQPAPVLANLAPERDIFVDREVPALVVAAASSLEEGDFAAAEVDGAGVFPRSRHGGGNDLDVMSTYIYVSYMYSNTVF